jgi:hypothetical protein
MSMLRGCQEVEEECGLRLGRFGLGRRGLGRRGRLGQRPRGRLTDRLLCDRLSLVETKSLLKPVMTRLSTNAH